MSDEAKEFLKYVISMLYGNSQRWLVFQYYDNIELSTPEFDELAEMFRDYQYDPSDPHDITFHEAIEDLIIKCEIDLDGVCSPNSNGNFSKKYACARYGYDTGIKLWKAIYDKIDSMDTEYEDSFRVKELNVEEEEEGFRKANSCCGSHDWKETIDNRNFELGFNYGH